MQTATIKANQFSTVEHSGKFIPYAERRLQKPFQVINQVTFNVKSSQVV